MVIGNVVCLHELFGHTATFVIVSKTGTPGLEATGLACLGRGVIF